SAACTVAVGRYRRVVTIDPVLKSLWSLDREPDGRRRMWCSARAGPLTSERKDFPGLLTTAASDCRQTGPELAWRACLRFADIDAPVSVQVGRKINFDAGQTAGLIACP